MTREQRTRSRTDHTKVNKAREMERRRKQWARARLRGIDRWLRRMR